MKRKEEIIEKLENPNHPMHEFWCNLKNNGLADLFIKNATSSFKDRSPLISKLKNNLFDINVNKNASFFCAINFNNGAQI